MTDRNALNFELITCVVQRGKADKIVKAAMKAGAGGATIFFARGTGIREKMGLLGIAISPEKEVILIVSPASQTNSIFDTLVDAAKLDTPGHGMAFVSPISRIAGVLASNPQERS